MMRGSLILSIIVFGLASATYAQDRQPQATARPEPSRASTSISEGSAAIVAGVPISTKQVDEKLGARLIQLRTQEYRLRRSILDEMITTVLLEREAAARKIPVSELVTVEIDAKAKAVSDDEARAVYDSARERMGGMSETDAVRSISTSMQRQRVYQRRTEFAASLRAKHDVRLLLDPPRLHIPPPRSPTKGPADAVVTIVEFSDFQCPYCGQAQKTVSAVIDKYRGKIRLIFQDFPLPIHKDAPKAAEAAACAGEQGKFWEMHDELFRSQEKLKVEDLKQYAAGLGLDARSFSSCLDSGRHADDWRRAKALGEEYGVSGTPAFFVNGIPLFGAAPLQEFIAIIDDELARVDQRSTSASKSAPR